MTLAHKARAWETASFVLAIGLWFFVSSTASAQTFDIVYDFDSPSHDLAKGAPSAAIVRPKSFDASKSFSVFVFFHGWRNCVRQLVESKRVACRKGERQGEGWGLAKEFAKAGGNNLLFVPQLAYKKKSGKPGRWADSEYVNARLLELVSAQADSSKMSHLYLLAHSAGFESAAAVISARPDFNRSSDESIVDGAVLFDAFYAGRTTFREFVESGEADLLSYYLGGKPKMHSTRLRHQIKTDNYEARRTRIRHAKIPKKHLVESIRWLRDRARK